MDSPVFLWKKLRKLLKNILITRRIVCSFCKISCQEVPENLFPSGKVSEVLFAVLQETGIHAIRSTRLEIQLEAVKAVPWIYEDVKQVISLFFAGIQEQMNGFSRDGDSGAPPSGLS